MPRLVVYTSSCAIQASHSAHLLMLSHHAPRLTKAYNMTTRCFCCTQDAIETFLHYLYYDKVDARTSPQHVVAVLHVAHYYGAGRLVGLCEAILAKELKRGDRDDEGLCCFCLCTQLHLHAVHLSAAFACCALTSCICMLFICCFKL